MTWWIEKTNPQPIPRDRTSRQMQTRIHTKNIYEMWCWVRVGLFVLRWWFVGIPFVKTKNDMTVVKTKNYFSDYQNCWTPLQYNNTDDTFAWLMIKTNKKENDLYNLTNSIWLFWLTETRTRPALRLFVLSLSLDHFSRLDLTCRTRFADVHHWNFLQWVASSWNINLFLKTFCVRLSWHLIA